MGRSNQQSLYRQQAAEVATVVSKLLGTKLQGAPHRCLEQLCQTIQEAVSAMRAADSEALLEGDQCLVAALVAKLPSCYAMDWGEHNARAHPRGAATWRKFVAWLSKRIRRAEHKEA